MKGSLINNLIIQLSKRFDKLNKFKILYFINPVEKYILVCNKKCASTSLRRLFSRESNPEIIFHVKNPFVLNAWLQENDISDYKKIMICRNPYARFLSFYFDKIVKVANSQSLRWAYTRLFLFIFAGKRHYKFIITAISENRHSVAIRLLVSRIPTIIFKYDSYFSPQSNIYTLRGIKLLDFDYIIKLEDFNNQLFKQITGKHLFQENTTSANTTNYRKFLDDTSIRKLTKEYKEDFLQFDYQPLSVSVIVTEI